MIFERKKNVMSVLNLIDKNFWAAIYYIRLRGQSLPIIIRFERAATSGKYKIVSLFEWFPPPLPPP